MRLIRFLFGALCVLSLAPAAPAEAAGYLRKLHSSSAAPPPAAPTLLFGVLTPSTYGIENAGWTATSTPANQGNSGDYGYGDADVAYFTDWPFQTFSTATTIGVLAYHQPTAAEQALGITNNANSATMICDGGTPVTTTTITHNARLNVDQFNFLIPSGAGAPADGVHSCRAIVKAATGPALVLQGSKIAGPDQTFRSLFFYSNFNGTAPGQTRFVATTGTDNGTCGATSGAPCATIHQAKENINTAIGDVGGSTICVAAGTYAYDVANETQTRDAADQYLTVSGDCNGDDGSHVILTATTGGLRVTKIHLRNLIWDATAVTSGGGFTNAISLTGQFQPVCWLDGVTMNGPGRFVGGATPFDGSGTNCTGGAYQTNVTQNNWHDGDGTYSNGNSINHIGSDGFSGAQLAMNLTLTDQSNVITATGNSTNGSATITNVSNFTDLVPGATMNACDQANITISSVNVGAQSLVISTPCTATLTAAAFTPNSHPDNDQYGNFKSWSNIILYKVNVVSSAGDGQGAFVQGAISGLVMDQVNWRNSGPGALVNVSNITNWLSIGTTWNSGGGWTLTGTFTDGLFLSNTCVAVKPSVQGKAGLDFSHSPTC